MEYQELSSVMVVLISATSILTDYYRNMAFAIESLSHITLRLMGRQRCPIEKLKHTVNASRKDWAAKLDDALWAYWTTFKTLLGTSP